MLCWYDWHIIQNYSHINPPLGQCATDNTRCISERRSVLRDYDCVISLVLLARIKALSPCGRCVRHYLNQTLTITNQPERPTNMYPKIRKGGVNKVHIWRITMKSFTKNVILSQILLTAKRISTTAAELTQIKASKIEIGSNYHNRADLRPNRNLNGKWYIF